MALTQQQLAELASWVEQYAAQTDDLTDRTLATLIALYAGQSFYNPASVEDIAEQAAAVSESAHLVAAGLALQYLSMTMPDMVGGPVGIPNLPLPPIRNGVDLRRVFERPMKMFRRLVAGGTDPADAFARSMQLLETLVNTNIRLAQREMTREILTYLAPRYGITGFRRVVRPELSRTGTCGLCLVASDVVYKVGVLEPIHDRCKCVPVPIVGEVDPGNSLNNLDLEQLYADSGSKLGEDLKKVRYKVDEHGELGPVLIPKSHRFKGKDDLRPESPSSDIRAENQERIDALLGLIDAAMQAAS